MLRCRTRVTLELPSSRSHECTIDHLSVDHNLLGDAILCCLTLGETVRSGQRQYRNHADPKEIQRVLHNILLDVAVHSAI